MDRKIAKIRTGKMVAGAVLLAFLVVAFIGMRMPMSHEGGHVMPFNCPFMENGSLCQMTFEDHLEYWKQAIKAPVSSVSSLDAVLLAILALLAASHFWLSRRERLLFFWAGTADRWRELAWKLGNWLHRAFSQGILNPKIW